MKTPTRDQEYEDSSFIADLELERVGNRIDLKKYTRRKMLMELMDKIQEEGTDQFDIAVRFKEIPMGKHKSPAEFSRKYPPGAEIQLYAHVRWYDETN